MLVKDSEQVRVRKAQDGVIRNRLATVEEAKKEAKNSALVGSVTDKQRQKGKGLTATAFMTKLRTINKDLVLEPHPYRHHKINADKACLYLILPDGTKNFLMVCENDFMPEWSVMRSRNDKVRVPDHKPEGFWKPVEVPWNEVWRGWRTVLIRLIRSNIVNLTDVERVFGPGDRESWKVLTEKGRGVLPI